MINHLFPNKTQINIKDWGAIKSAFSNFVRTIEAKGKHIIFIAHESEEKSGDKTIKRPDCSGSARKDIMKDLDFVGYMYAESGKRFVSFIPSESFYAKNTLGHQQPIVAPMPNGSNDFVQKNIITPFIEKAESEAEALKKYNALIKNCTVEIDDLSDAEAINKYISEMDKLPVIADSTVKVKALIHKRATSLKLIFDKDKKQYVGGSDVSEKDNADVA